MAGNDAKKHPIHLGLGASASVEPEFTGAMEWYAGYAERHAQDGVEGRLVTLHSFTEPWNVWEMHPKGSEVVLCTAGEISLIQEATDGSATRVTLGPSQYAINQPGVWHTADIETQATALFITAGLGTEHRPR
jgi:hypothetical protein